jgi:hypothetical protein
MKTSLLRRTRKLEARVPPSMDGERAMKLFSTRARRPVVALHPSCGTRGHGMDPLACFAEVFGDGF